jgi:hypothetical protein
VGKGVLVLYGLAAVRFLIFLSSRSWIGALAAAIVIVLLPVVVFTRE